MDKDLKIAIVVIAIIVMIAVFEDSKPIGQMGSAHANKNMFYSQADHNSSKNSVKKTSKATTSRTEKSCTHNGIELKGNVQFVDSFPDLKIKYVSSFADIHVEFVSSFPDDCGQWKEVSSFPDFKVQVVDSFPDIEVKKVSSFPGMQ